MPFRHVVVDGSNIATEGRSHPSLAQLDEALEEFRREYPKARLTVVVDASFSHRIDAGERSRFEKEELAGRLVSPPAGAIGRGDAFLLRIAERTGAAVLSNDSFQEFHGEHEWLFEENRLIGGKPVRSVGWIFTPRNPVRGTRSRAATSAAKRANRARTSEATVRKAINEAKEEAVEPETKATPRRRRRGAPPPQAVNEPLAFITFIADYKLGDRLEGEVDSFTSHGAFVRVDGCRCYVPLAGLGKPPPRSARSVLSKGDRRTFVLQALDPPRRGIELALPAVAKVSGTPSAETVAAEISGVGAASRRPVGKASRGKAPSKPSKPVKKPASSTRKATKQQPTKKAQPAKKQQPRKKQQPGEKQLTRKKQQAGERPQARERRQPGKQAQSRKKQPAKKRPSAKTTVKKPVVGKAAAKKSPSGAKAVGLAQKGSKRSAQQPKGRGAATAQRSGTGSSPTATRRRAPRRRRARGG
jgi:hypothetical protein